MGLLYLSNYLTENTQLPQNYRYSLSDITVVLSSVDSFINFFVIHNTNKKSRYLVLAF